MQNATTKIGQVKISNEVIVAIWKDIKAGLTTKELVEKYGVSKTTIYRIKNKIDRYGKVVNEYEESLAINDGNTYDAEVEGYEENEEDEYFDEEDCEEDESMVLNYYKVKIKKILKPKNLKIIYPLETEEDVRKLEDYIDDSILDLKRELEKDGYVDMIIPVSKKNDLILYIVTDNDIKTVEIKMALEENSAFNDFDYKIKEIDADKFDETIIAIS